MLQWGRRRSGAGAMRPSPSTPPTPPTQELGLPHTPNGHSGLVKRCWLAFAAWAPPAPLHSPLGRGTPWLGVASFPYLELVRKIGQCHLVPAPPRPCPSLQERRLQLENEGQHNTGGWERLGPRPQLGGSQESQGLTLSTRRAPPGLRRQCCLCCPRRLCEPDPAELAAWSPSHTETQDTNACCWGRLTTWPQNAGGRHSPTRGRTA